jgi:putative oxidoreductase
MVAAYFMRHFPKSFWSLENAGEPAVLFCFIFFIYGDAGFGDLERRCSLRPGERLKFL